jgi:hypothetical protein
VPLPTSSLCATQKSSASSVGSIDAFPSARSEAMQAPIHCTCCSIDTIMLENTDGLAGPVIV